MINMKELTVQDGAIEWLQELGYNHVEGGLLERDLKKVVLEKEFHQYLKTAYPAVPQTALNQAFAAFTQQEGMDLDHRNQDFHRKMTQGVSVTWKAADGKENAQHIYPINYKDVDKNSFICADEVTIIGKNTVEQIYLFSLMVYPLLFLSLKTCLMQLLV